MKKPHSHSPVNKAAARKGKKAATLYIGIEDAANFRRMLLEASKSLVQFLKGHELIVQTRAEKLQHIARLRNTLDDISHLVAKAKELMPNVEKESIEEEEKIKLKQPKPSKEEEISAEAESERLDRELQTIESKLQSV